MVPTDPSYVHIPDERVHLRRLHVVKLLHRLLDVPLVRLEVNDEDERIVILDLLHCRLSVERVLDCSELVHPRHVWNGLPRVFRVARKTKGFGSVEGDGSADFAKRVRRCALQSSLLRCFRLRILRFRGG